MKVPANLSENTENLQYANWIRLQIGDFLKETELPSEKQENLQKWMKNFGETLASIKFSDVVENKKFTCSVRTAGDLELEIGDSFCPSEAEILLVMPTEALRKSDYLNCTFLDKRRKMIERIQKKVLEITVGKIEHWSDHYPVLVVAPEGLGCHARVIIDVVLPEDFVGNSRFLPDRSNLRLNWFTSLCPEELRKFIPKNTCEEDNLIVSPFTNGLHARGSARLRIHDLMRKHLSADSSNLRDAYRLCCVWLRRRRLHGDKGMSKVVVAALLMWLCVKKRIHRDMSSYQILRNFWSFLANNGLRETGGISLEKAQNSVEMFKKHFPVVVLDPSGLYNVAQMMEEHVVDLIERGARHALNILSSRVDYAFQSLFVEDTDFYRQFDAVYSVPEATLERVCQWHGSWKFLMDRGLKTCGQEACVRNVLIPALGKALAARLERSIDALRALIHAELTCHCRAEYIGLLPSRTIGKQLIGVILARDALLTQFEKGPVVGTKEAEEFRALWGENRVQSRLMPDGSVVEAVVWAPEETRVPGGVVTRIIKHIFNLHFNSSTKKGKDGRVYMTADFDPVIFTASKRAAEVCSAAEELTKEIIGLKDAVLGVTSVQGISAVFGKFEPCPPQRLPSVNFRRREQGEDDGESESKKRKLDSAVANRLICPEYLETSDCVCAPQVTAP
ncbi:unnamed protein product [Notodromas monacha]|uniref:Nucleolar protein 6 n=1 Tax=Notodromas monacha TaxID=399045 RepID=A0A7R9BH32_9CRUS|nr:unnamed protein product [Notodromas monacha]CAG0914530.1 unnamed protein product [Notodromas monacha]